MSDAAALFALYENLWRSEESPWADGAIAFAPFDDYAILREVDIIASFWHSRRLARRLIAADFAPLADWRDGPVAIAMGRLALTIRAAHDSMDERRDLRLVIVACDQGGVWKLFHLAEAAEAALVDMIEGYRSEASGRTAP